MCLNGVWSVRLHEGVRCPQAHPQDPANGDKKSQKDTEPTADAAQTASPVEAEETAVAANHAPSDAVQSSPPSSSGRKSRASTGQNGLPCIKTPCNLDDMDDFVDWCATTPDAACYM